MNRRDFLKRTGLSAGLLKAFPGRWLSPEAECAALRQYGTRSPYEAAYERLKEQYSLERVAREKIEVTWDNLLGMATPLSKQIPVQACFHYQMVFVHPDLSLTLGREPGSLALGFALGTPAQLPNWNQVTRRLHRGYQPIVESEWKSGPIAVSQTAFGFLPRDEAVVTGKETQYVMVRMRLTNTTNQPQKTALLLLVGSAGRMGGAGGANGLSALTGLLYGASHYPFAASVARWRAGPSGVKMEDGALFVRDRLLLTFRSSAPAPATFCERLPNNSGDTGGSRKLNNCLKFELQLNPNETREIDIVTAGASKLLPAEERSAMTAVAFTDALKRAESSWDRALAGGMQLTTLEPRLNDIYKALVLAGFGCISQSPDHSWREAYQTPFLWEVLPWETACVLDAMISIGYHQEIEPCLRFFVDRQVGVGPQSANHGPVGAKSFEGTYPGLASADWMNFTGSTLWMLGTYYRYTHRAQWLKKNTRSIVAAWNWIQRERAGNRILSKKGQKVEYYGLLPAGRAGDWPEGSYIFTFTDNYTWYGMSEIAKAFQEAGLPQAERFTKEAEEYRQCILDVMRREELVEPETGLLLVPNAVFYKKGYRPSWWMADGPVQMFYTGLLRADDKRFPPMLEFTKRKHGVLLGMHETYGHPEWYNNQTDHTYYKCYLARGEFEKALLTFYSSFVYGMSHDCYQTLERTNVYEPNYGSYQPNGSNIGRLLEMLKRMVIDEQHAGQLWLLRGCPRRWLKAGEKVEVQDAPTYFGKMQLKVESQVDQEKVRAELVLQRGRWSRLKTIYLRVPHPARQRIKQVFVNGKVWRQFDPEKELIELHPAEGRYRIEIHY